MLADAPLIARIDAKHRAYGIEKRRQVERVRRGIAGRLGKPVEYRSGDAVDSALAGDGDEHTVIERLGVGVNRNGLTEHVITWVVHGFLLAQLVVVRARTIG